MRNIVNYSIEFLIFNALTGLSNESSPTPYVQYVHEYPFTDNILCYLFKRFLFIRLVDIVIGMLRL